MIVSVYRSWVDGLSFEPTGAFVAKVEVPDGSSIEPVSGIFDFSGFQNLGSPVLMVPSDDDPSIRYAWGAVDILVSAANRDDRFHVVELTELDRHAIIDVVGAN